MANKRSETSISNWLAVKFSLALEGWTNMRIFQDFLKVVHRIENGG